MTGAALTYPRFEHDGDACWYVSHWGSARSLRPLVTLLHNLAVAGALCASYGYGYAYAHAARHRPGLVPERDREASAWRLGDDA